MSQSLHRADDRRLRAKEEAGSRRKMARFAPLWLPRHSRPARMTRSFIPRTNDVMKECRNTTVRRDSSQFEIRFLTLRCRAGTGSAWLDCFFEEEFF